MRFDKTSQVYHTIKHMKANKSTVNVQYPLVFKKMVVDLMRAKEFEAEEKGEKFNKSQFAVEIGHYRVVKLGDNLHENGYRVGTKVGQSQLIDRWARQYNDFPDFNPMTDKGLVFSLSKKCSDNYQHSKQAGQGEYARSINKIVESCAKATKRVKTLELVTLANQLGYKVSKKDVS